MKYLYLFGLFLCTSCGLEKEEFDFKDFETNQNNVLINYYLTVISTEEFDSISFSFLYTRAFLNNSVIRNVYLDPKEINVRLNRKELISLGSSSIEPLFIEGYDFGFSQFRLRKDNRTIDQFVWGFDEAFAKAEFTPMEGDTLDIHFELDVDASIVLDSAGKNWITPKVKLKRK